MSSSPNGLATRCTQCGTVFRVVPDQLRVSDGYVRCGRCGEVFNAAASLLDLETGKPAEAVPGSRVAAEVDDGPGVGDRDGIGTEHGSDRWPPTPPPAVDEPPAPDPAMRPSADTFADDRLVAAADGTVAAAPVALSPPPDNAADAELPSFVRRAERSQRWRTPRVQRALAFGAVAAGLLLLAQAVLAWRDTLAAHLPAARAPLAAVCSVLGCSVVPLRGIDHLSVESSGLVRVEQSSLYRLSIAMRNRAAWNVALPALELAVSDAQGKLLARRVLRPTELGSTQTEVAAGRDLALQATLQFSAGEAVAGYTVELFYP